MKILVGSENPVKIAATEEAFAHYFGPVQVTGLAVGSGVPAQPVDDDTFAGAQNRALALKRLAARQGLAADFYVGIEGGIVRRYGRWFSFGAMCIVDAQGRMGFGASSHFELPARVVRELLDGGAELGQVIDALSGEENTKQKGGAIGFLTRGLMDRQALYVQGLVVALIHFVNGNLYGEE